MAKSSEGRFAAKHPAGTTVAPKVKKTLMEQLSQGMISCVAAHETAGKLGIDPKTVGQAIDLLEGRIHKCQLGLFGYGEPKRIVSAGHPVPSDLNAAIQSVVQDGRVTCADAWAVAERFQIPRLALGNACESLGIKIVRCQLGAF